MGVVLNIQLSVFCNYKIEPTTKNISALMEKINSLGIKEFLPNVTTEQTIDLVKGKVDTVSNLGFVTTDKSGQIVCQDDRIDCVFNFTPDSEVSLSASIRNIQDIMIQLLKEYEVLSNRLALNVNLLSDSYNGNLQDTNFGQNVVSTLDFYNGKTLKEWSTRENVWHPIMISAKEEMLNVITELSMVTSNPGDEKRLLCHMDINTIPENTGFRFNDEKFVDFVAGVEPIAESIKSNFEELSNNAE